MLKNWKNFQYNEKMYPVLIFKNSGHASPSWSPWYPRCPWNRSFCILATGLIWSNWTKIGISDSCSPRKSSILFFCFSIHSNTNRFLRWCSFPSALRKTCIFTIRSDHRKQFQLIKYLDSGMIYFQMIQLIDFVFNLPHHLLQRDFLDCLKFFFFFLWH